MNEKERDQEWLVRVRKMRHAELTKVVTRWQSRAEPFGFEEKPPPLDSSYKEELSAYALRARTHYRKAYVGQLPEAVSKFGTACEALMECREILEENGHHFGLFSDIELLIDQLSKQIADLATK